MQTCAPSSTAHTNQKAEAAQASTGGRAGQGNAVSAHSGTAQPRRGRRFGCVMNPEDVRTAIKIQTSRSTWMSHLKESRSQRQGVGLGHWDRVPHQPRPPALPRSPIPHAPPRGWATLTPSPAPRVRGNSPQPAQLNPHGPEPLKVPWVFSIMRIIQKEDWDLPGIQGKVKDEKKKKPGRTCPQILTVLPLGCGSPSNFYLLCSALSPISKCFVCLFVCVAVKS